MPKELQRPVPWLVLFKMPQVLNTNSHAQLVLSAPAVVQQRKSLLVDIPSNKPLVPRRPIVTMVTVVPLAQSARSKMLAPLAPTTRPTLIQLLARLATPESIAIRRRSLIVRRVSIAQAVHLSTTSAHLAHSAR